MKKIISSFCAAALLGTSLLAGMGSAEAAGVGHRRYQQQDRYIGDFCGRNPRARQCNDWRSNREHWGDEQYRGFYRSHRHDRGFDNGVAASIFGLAIGTMLNGAVNNGSSHVRACQNRYRSYNVRTDSYMGYDGKHHRCQL